MSITLEKAITIAKAEIEDTGFDILTISENDDLFVFSFGNTDGLLVPGISPISISKSTGEIKDILLPSDEGFALLNTLTKIEV